jgi:hypothetical protein
VNTSPMHLDDDQEDGDTLAAARAHHDDSGRAVDRRGPQDQSIALLFIRSVDEVDTALRAVNGLLSARRAAGVVDVIVGAFVGPAGGLTTLEPWVVDDVIGAGHLVRSSCTFCDRWTLTWFDAPIGCAGSTRARRRQLLAALWWDRHGGGLSAEATFIPVLAPDEDWGTGCADVIAELAARHPDLRLGGSVLVDDRHIGVVRPV